jgi:hypothetical protein
MEGLRKLLPEVSAFTDGCGKRLRTVPPIFDWNHEGSFWGSSTKIVWEERGIIVITTKGMARREAETS